MPTTVDEPWTELAAQPGHHYRAAAEFALTRIGQGHGRKCLVVGSPPFEVRAFRDVGWNVTFVDVRTPPAMDGVERVVADACSLPFPDRCFDALSSTCVVCHAGLGRYGDPRSENGDAECMAEFARVLKPAGLAAVMLGPVLPGMKGSLVFGDVHRAWTLEEALNLTARAGFRVRETALFGEGRWRQPGEQVVFNWGEAHVEFPFSYLTVFLESR